MSDKLIWTTEQRKISDLVPFEQNPRQMSEQQVKHLTESIEKFNLVEIPAVDTDNKIVAGHQRLKIMQILGRGDETTDVRVPNRKLTEEEYLEYNVRSNQNTGSWDFDMLANLFDEKQLLDIGFNARELDMVEFPELENTGPDEDDFNKDGAKYELMFSTKEDYSLFTSYLRSFKSQYEQSFTDSLLSFIKDNVKES